MRIKLFSCEIYISFLFAATITVLLATDRTGLLMPTLFAILLHETGHLFAMWVLDCAPNQIKLIPASIQITSPITPRYRNDIIIALSGPLTNILLFVVFYLNFLGFKNDFTLYCAIINLAIGIFNLLPILGLDGGTIVYSLFAKKTNPDRAIIYLKIITALFAIITLAVSIFLTVKGKVNITLYIIALYLTVIAIMKKF